MTIVAGFRCSDGLVFGADTEEPASESIKLSKAKLFFVEEPSHAMVFGGAGHADYIDMAIEKIIGVVDRRDKRAELIKQSIEEVILDIHETHIRLDQSDTKPSISLLVGIWTREDGLHLVKTASTAVRSVPGHESIGWGGNLADYLIATLAGPEMDAKGAILIATEVLRQTRAYVPYCGGEGNLAVLSKEGKITTLSGDELLSIEQFLHGFEGQIKHLRLIALNDEVSEDILQEKLENMKSFLATSKSIKAAFDHMKLSEEQNPSLKGKTLRAFMNAMFALILRTSSDPAFVEARKLNQSEQKTSESEP